MSVSVRHIHIIIINPSVTLRSSCSCLMVWAVRKLGIKCLMNIAIRSFQEHKLNHGSNILSRSGGVDYGTPYQRATTDVSMNQRRYSSPVWAASRQRRWLPPQVLVLCKMRTAQNKRDELPIICQCLNVQYVACPVKSKIVS